MPGLLGELFLPYQPDDVRIVVNGSDVAIDDRSATPSALLFHELATNATKYGALSTDAGLITLSCREDGDQIVLDWHERGGPAIMVPPTKTGFGTQLMELSAVRQLGGTVTRDWHPHGLAVTTCIPRSALSR